VFRLQYRHGFGGIARLENSVAASAEIVGQFQTDKNLVFNDENGLGWARRLRRHGLVSRHLAAANRHKPPWTPASAQRRSSDTGSGGRRLARVSLRRDRLRHQ
jgi:hypothetical protein